MVLTTLASVTIKRKKVRKNKAIERKKWNNERALNEPKRTQERRKGGTEKIGMERKHSNLVDLNPNLPMMMGNRSLCKRDRFST